MYKGSFIFDYQPVKYQYTVDKSDEAEYSDVAILSESLEPLVSAFSAHRNEALGFRNFLDQDLDPVLPVSVRRNCIPHSYQALYLLDAAPAG